MMDRDGPENQSKLEANTGSRSEAREYVRDSQRVTIGLFWFQFWLDDKWREIVKPITAA